ncbi:hypothetical protein DPMN_179271 [Dreissena polymorpha]|uniref:Uncharacterized protein n=1 Tax=Dreissena polymorpha TaxID=45954 RepID=A0A9D4EEF8_DREPO|nr:hypothetical protein DPMN_179271 [Dreissena polymorpha]
MKWLPPESAVLRLAQLMNLQIKYLETMGIHNATLPNFLQSPCLRKSSAGEIEYDFGPESSFQTLTDLSEFIAPPARNKRLLDNTPQSGKRRKRILTSTPRR